MARRRRGAYDAVEQRHAQAKRCTALQGFHQAACRGAVEKQFVTDSNIIRWDQERLAIHDKRDVANEGFIKNAVNQFAVVAAALGLAADFRSFGGGKVAHSCRLAVAGGPRQEPIWITR